MTCPDANPTAFQPAPPRAASHGQPARAEREFGHLGGLDSDDRLIAFWTNATTFGSPFSGFRVAPASRTFKPEGGHQFRTSGHRRFTGRRLLDPPYLWAVAGDVTDVIPSLRHANRHQQGALDKEIAAYVSYKARSTSPVDTPKGHLSFRARILAKVRRRSGETPTFAANSVGQGVTSGNRRRIGRLVGRPLLTAANH